MGNLPPALIASRFTTTLGLLRYTEKKQQYRGRDNTDNQKVSIKEKQSYQIFPRKICDILSSKLLHSRE
jgi:hypothetical protein